MFLQQALQNEEETKGSSMTMEGTCTKEMHQMVEGRATCNLPKTHLEQDFMPRTAGIQAEVCYGILQGPYWKITKANRMSIVKKIFV